MSKKYSIVVKEFLTGSQNNSLFDLYLPIIGSSALGVYKALIHEEEILKKLNSIQFEEDRLFEITDLNEKLFRVAIKKLEAMKLISTSINKKTNLKRFTIYAPLDAEEFMNNKLFSTTLKNKLGEENFEAVTFLLKDRMDVNEDDFEDVSTSFVDIFQEEFDSISTSLNEDDEKVTHISLVGKKKYLFQKKLQQKKLTQELNKYEIVLDYQDLEIISLLDSIVALGAFSEKEIAEFIFTAYNPITKDVNQKIIFGSIKKELSLREDSKKITNEKVLQKKYGNDVIDTKKYIEKNYPDQFSMTVEKMILDLKKEGFANGAIISLIDFSSFKNDGKIVVNYIRVIADSLQKRRMYSTEKIESYLNSIKSKIKNNPKLQKEFNIEVPMDIKEPIILEEFEMEDSKVLEKDFDNLINTWK